MVVDNYYINTIVTTKVMAFTATVILALLHHALTRTDVYITSSAQLRVNKW